MSVLIQTFHKKGFLSFLALFREIFCSLSGKNILSLATLSAIIYHIRSNKGIWADHQDWVNQSEYGKCIIWGWEFNNNWYFWCWIGGHISNFASCKKFTKSNRAVFKWLSKYQNQSNYKTNHKHKLITSFSQPRTNGIHICYAKWL